MKNVCEKNSASFGIKIYCRDKSGQVNWFFSSKHLSSGACSSFIVHQYLMHRQTLNREAISISYLPLPSSGKRLFLLMKRHYLKRVTNLEQFHTLWFSCRCFVIFRFLKYLKKNNRTSQVKTEIKLIGTDFVQRFGSWTACVARRLSRTSNKTVLSDLTLLTSNLRHLKNSR